MTAPVSAKIAAVIPTFNRADLLGRAIDSVLAQRRRPDEVIVVDDGSSDHTSQVIEDYSGDLTFRRKANGGVSSARNAGVCEASSDFVAFLDSDDFWYEDHLERIELAIAASGAGAGLYFSDQQLAPTRGTTAWQRAGFSIDHLYELADDGRIWAFIDKQPMTINAAVVRRDAYIAVGGCDERLACREDTHLFLKLGLTTSLCAVAGYAGRLTDDDAASLTNRYAVGRTYLDCTAVMYSDIRRSFGTRLNAGERHLVSRRVAAAHWSLAKQAGPGSRRRGFVHLGRALANDPTMLLRKVSRRMRSSVLGQLQA